jgi:trk system potassium uptake protein TrkA
VPKAIVIGCGRVGSALALRLLGSGWEVVVVDRDEQTFLRLGDDWRGGLVPGHAFDTEVLERAGIAEADALLAVTSGDNTNIVVAQVAVQRFGVGSVAARILDPGRADFYSGRGFEVVSPAKDAIETLTSWTTSPERVA